MRVIDGWSDRVLNIDASNAIYDDSGPGYSTKRDDGPFATEAETRFPRVPKTWEPACVSLGLAKLLLLQKIPRRSSGPHCFRTHIYSSPAPP